MGQGCGLASAMLLIHLYIHSKSSSLFQGAFLPRTCLYMSSLHHTAEVCRHSSSLQMGCDLLAATPVDGYISGTLMKEISCACVIFFLYIINIYIFLK